MNFKTRYAMRNYFLRVFYWCFGVTSLLAAYTFIRWQKAIYYTDWTFKNVNMNNPKHITWIIDNYLAINGFSIYWCFIIAIATDIILRR